MKEEFVSLVIQDMLPVLNNAQLEKLKASLEKELVGKQVVEEEKEEKMENNEDFVKKFISSKRLEGCSEKSLLYYGRTINAVFKEINKPLKTIVTDDLRNYLTAYQSKNEVSKVTIDNVRRILSSFFRGWRMKTIS